MASGKDVIIGQLQMGQMLIEKFTADLSDAEYLAAPFDGGNHATWILGHIATTEDRTVAGITGTEQRIPQAQHDQFAGGSKCVSDAASYPSRKEMDESFRKARGHLIEALTAFDESKWEDPSPEGMPKDFFPTVGSAWSLQGIHQFWHIGQLTSCRAALGKAPAL